MLVRPATRRKGQSRRYTGERRGLSALEVVMTTALIIPPLAMMAYHAIQALRVLYTIIGSMIASPIL